MTTLQNAASAYQAVNNISACPQDFSLPRVIDNICAVERLCYKVAKAVLKDPISEEINLTIKTKYQDRFNDKRVLSSAVKSLKDSYGDVDLKICGSILTINWKNGFVPSLKSADHLNCKLLEAVLSNKEEKVQEKLSKGADPAFKGPFNLTPDKFTHSNREIYEMLRCQNKASDSTR